MIPAVNPAYCNIGAGVAQAPNGMYYYILQAAYTSGKSCGEYKSPGGGTTSPGGSTSDGREGGVSQSIVPVKIATPDADGKIFHMSRPGSRAGPSRSRTRSPSGTWKSGTTCPRIPSSDRAKAVYSGEQHRGLFHPHAGGDDPAGHAGRRWQDRPHRPALPNPDHHLTGLWGASRDDLEPEWIRIDCRCKSAKNCCQPGHW